MAGSELERYLRSLNGNCDYVLSEFAAYVADSSKSQKDTDAIMNELLLDIFLHLNGEKHCVLVFDCGESERGRGVRVPVCTPCSRTRVESHGLVSMV